MKIAIRSLTTEGVSLFDEFLDRLIQGEPVDVPSQLLTDKSTSTSLSLTQYIDTEQRFETRFELGRYLAERTEPLLGLPGMSGDVGLWTWLTLAFFDQVCPRQSNGTRKVAAKYKYILSRDYRHQYRHLVRTPVFVYNLHGEHGSVVLLSKPHVHSEAAEQLLSREALFTNRALFEVVNHLYIEARDGGTPKLRRGAAGSRGGTLHRMGKIMKQFDLTFDFRSMKRQEIHDLLPREFDRFKR